MSILRVSVLVALTLVPAGLCLGQRQTAADLYGLGADAFRRAQYAEAADLLSAADSRSPGLKDALLLRAKALVRLDRYEEAEAALRLYLKTHAGSADATFLLGFVQFRRNRPRDSLATYTAAAALQRPAPDDFKIVGLDYVLLEDYPDAVRWLERSVKENPIDSEAVYYLGRAYYSLNWFDKAVDAFEHAIKLNPLYAKAHNNLGLALAAQNKPDLAEQSYRRAIQIGELSAGRSELPYINLSELLIDHNRASEALDLLGAAERIDPRSDKIEQLRGRALLMRDRLEEAEAAFRAAIAIRPDDGVLHYQLGRLLRRMGRDEDSKREFERSKALLGARSVQSH